MIFRKCFKFLASQAAITKGGSHSPPGPIAQAPMLKPVSKEKAK